MTGRLVISEKELEAVLQLDGAGRYAYFVKRVADWETAWGLWQNGWTLVADDVGAAAFPLWPAREYAEACASGEWVNCEPAEITLEDLLETLLPQLEKDGVSVAIFPTPLNTGTVVVPASLADDLREEGEQYE